MKRRNAIILFGSLVLLCAGYMAWCGRCFYMKPKLGFPSGVPADVREQFEHWYGHNDILRPEPFAWDAFRHMLMHPWSDDYRLLAVEHDGVVWRIDFWYLDTEVDHSVFSHPVPVMEGSGMANSPWVEDTRTSFMSSDGEIITRTRDAPEPVVMPMN